MEIRRFGFKGSGQNYRRMEHDLASIINIQGSSGGAHFYINLGAQPTFIPTDGDLPVNPSTFKEYECVFRRRVGKDWGWHPDDAQFRDLIAALETQQRLFFDDARAFPAAIGSEPVEALLAKYRAPRTRLHVARACAARGMLPRSREIAREALLETPETATFLRRELEALSARQ
jgi:hypothetical protein